MGSPCLGNYQTIPDLYTLQNDLMLFLEEIGETIVLHGHQELMLPTKNQCISRQAAWLFISVKPKAVIGSVSQHLMRSHYSGLEFCTHGTARDCKRLHRIASNGTLACRTKTHETARCKPISQDHIKGFPAQCTSQWHVQCIQPSSQAGGNTKFRMSLIVFKSIETSLKSNRNSLR